MLAPSPPPSLTDPVVQVAMDVATSPERTIEISLLSPQNKSSPSRGGKRTGRWDRTRTTIERREDQRRQILLAAAAVFGDRGFARSTVQHIIERANISRRTFYEHFDDLRTLLLELHAFVAQVVFQSVEMATQTEPVRRRKLEVGIRAFLTLLAQHAGLARVLFREIRVLGPEHEVRRESVVHRFAGLLMEGFGHAYAEKVLKRPPDELTIFALVSAIEAVGMRYVDRNEAHRAPEAVPALVRLCESAFQA
jgi:AcrR family transcriptional regulator